MNKLKVAFIGIAHTHAGCLYNEFMTQKERVEWVGYSDIESELGETAGERCERNFAAAKDMPYYENYRDILDLSPDLVIVNTELQDHTRVVGEILERNINVLVEKPMATNMQEAQKMYAAAKKSKAELIINWPIAWFSYFNLIKKLADEGVVGDILRVCYRSPATWGPYDLGKYSESELKKMWWYNRENGGGAIMDYACYGCVLSTWIFGKKAQSVYGIRKNFLHGFSDIEDYSAFLLDFGTGVGFLEGSWSTFNSGEIPTGPIVYGTKGTLVSDRYTNAVKLYKTPSHSLEPPDEVFCDAPEAGNAGVNVVEHFLDNKPLHELLTLEFNMMAQAALDAGIRSCGSGKAEKA